MEACPKFVVWIKAGHVFVWAVEAIESNEFRSGPRLTVLIQTRWPQKFRTAPTFVELRQVATLERIYSSVLLVQCKQTKFYGANMRGHGPPRFDRPLTENCGVSFRLETMSEIPLFEAFQLCRQWKQSYLSKHLPFICYIWNKNIYLETRTSVHFTGPLKGHSGSGFLKFFLPSLTVQ